MDPGQSNLYQTAVYELAQASGYRFQVRNTLTTADLDPSVKGGLSEKLENELSTGPVVVTTLGTLWHLALRAESKEEAEAVTREIAVTEKRDRGFLLNPNYQGFRLVAVEKMELVD